MRFDEGRKLRGAVLKLLYSAYTYAPRKGMGGPTIRKEIEKMLGGIEPVFRTDDECMAVCRQLVGLGIATETEGGCLASEQPGLRHMFYSLTSEGVRLGMTQAPHPDIETDYRS